MVIFVEFRKDLIDNVEFSGKSFDNSCLYVCEAREMNVSFSAMMSFLAALRRCGQEFPRSILWNISTS